MRERDGGGKEAGGGGGGGRILQKRGARGRGRKGAGDEGARELQRHITNAIPDPHGSAHIALLFGFN